MSQNGIMHTKLVCGFHFAPDTAWDHWHRAGPGCMPLLPILAHVKLAMFDGKHNMTPRCQSIIRPHCYGHIQAIVLYTLLQQYLDADPYSHRYPGQGRNQEHFENLLK